MKVTYEQIVEAMAGLSKVSDIRRAPATSRKLFQLRVTLGNSFDFYSEEEPQLVEELGGKVAENGLILFADPAKKREYAERRKELLKMEEDVPMEKKIQIRDAELKEISGEEMWALRHFVDFTE